MNEATNDRQLPHSLFYMMQSWHPQVSTYTLYEPTVRLASREQGQEGIGWQDLLALV
jgi:hypothetical protein